MTRHTFVVHVHPDGISTLENLSTHELVRISDLGTVGPQIKRWLADQREPTPPRPPDSERDRRESVQGSAP